MALPSGLKKKQGSNKMKAPPPFVFCTNLTLIIAKEHEDSPASSHKKVLGLTNLASTHLRKKLSRQRSCQNKSLSLESCTQRQQGWSPLV